MKEIFSRGEGNSNYYFKLQMPTSLSNERLGILVDRLEEMGIECAQPMKVYAGGRSTEGGGRDVVEMFISSPDQSVAAFLQENYEQVTVFMVSPRHPDLQTGERGESLSPPELLG